MPNCSTTKLNVALLTACFLGFGIPAHAASFSFNFDVLNAAVTAGGIQTYMNGVIGAAGSVAITGTNGGAVTDKYWDGDGHVVGPTCPGNGLVANANSATSACGGTLGTDTFVRTAFTSGVVASFTFAFTLPNIVIDSVTFDYEIFPDGSCPSLANCGTYNSSTLHYANNPDMYFSTNLGQVFHDWGSVPSGKSYVMAAETAPQKVVLGYNYVTPAGVNSFTFTDWPATIGIDNFVVNYHTNTPVPEPGAIILLGTVATFVFTKLRQRMSV